MKYSISDIVYFAGFFAGRLRTKEHFDSFRQLRLFPGADLLFWDIQDEFFTDIDDLRAVVLPLPLQVHTIAGMDMAVEQVLGVVGVDELQQSL